MSARHDEIMADRQVARMNAPASAPLELTREDAERISAEASAALDRIARRDRARSDLLYEMLGSLSYHARQGARLTYTNEYGTHVDQPLSELVDEFRARVAEIR